MDSDTVFTSTMKQLRNLIKSWSKTLLVDRKVRYSVGKYEKTYELLEKYDGKATNDPKEVAEPERLAPYIRELQKGP